MPTDHTFVNRLQWGLASVMGGSQVEVATPVPASDYLGLDWFLLNVLVLAVLFVPIEQRFAQWPEQRIFHFMGEPSQTRHLVVANEQAVLS